MEMTEAKQAVRQAKEWIRTNRATLLQAGIITIVATYSGEGDSGCLDDEVEFLDKLGSPVGTKVPDDLYDLLEALHEEAAPEGYENGEGGGGEFRFDVDAETITHESYYFIVERSYNAIEEY
jgi:hypothetical protein